jgi:hypothetical protein
MTLTWWARSSALAGSSSSSSGVSWASRAAIATRWRSPPGQGAHVARGQVFDFHRGQRVQRRLVVVAALPVAPGVVGVARRQHGVHRAVGEGVAARLRQVGAPAREFFQRPVVQQAAVELHRAALGLAQAGDGA